MGGDHEPCVVTETPATPFRRILEIRIGKEAARDKSPALTWKSCEYGYTRREVGGGGVEGERRTGETNSAVTPAHIARFALV